VRLSKTKRRADSNTENPTIKKETFMKNQKITSVLLALSCFAVLSTAAQGRYQPPRPYRPQTPRLGEDRGNNNSAAENVDALNINTTGQYITAHGWHALSANTSGSYNTSTVVTALSSNMAGSRNSAVGAYSLQNNTTGSANNA
jgi:hypothetical protein